MWSYCQKMVRFGGHQRFDLSKRVPFCAGAGTTLRADAHHRRGEAFQQNHTNQPSETLEECEQGVPGYQASISDVL